MQEFEVIIQSISQRVVEKLLKEEGFVKSLAENIVLAQNKQNESFDPAAMVGDLELCEMFRVSKITLMAYRKQGMPYINTRPVKYILADALQWYKQNKEMKRNVANR